MRCRAVPPPCHFSRGGCNRGGAFFFREALWREDGRRLVGGVTIAFFNKGVGVFGVEVPANPTVTLRRKTGKTPREEEEHRKKYSPKSSPKHLKTIPGRSRGGLWDPSGPPVRKRAEKRRDRHQSVLPFGRCFSHFSQKWRSQFCSEFQRAPEDDLFTKKVWN